MKISRPSANLLLQALARVNHGVVNVPQHENVVCEAADRVLAVVAKGRTWWSRVIMKSWLKMKFRKEKSRIMATAAVTESNRWRKSRVSVSGGAIMIEDELVLFICLLKLRTLKG
ncbi:transcription factor bHLH147-like [Senna tora]|uniref:Transcription factor bHLH147-like n=1 Tax=Senna tora TaxID=362788 RepID=A0A834T5P6_9FABA|nr:transcription factor bHLH147-like [Senna tora]